MDKSDTHRFVDNMLKSSFYFGVASSLVKVLVPVNVLLVIASLSPYQYGVYKLSFSIFVIANSLLLSGINGLVLNDASHYYGNKELGKAKRLLMEFFILRIVLSVIATFLFYILSQYIADYYSSSVSSYLKILSVLFITDAIITIIDITLKSKLDYFGSSLVSIMPELIKFIFVCYFSFLTTDGLNILRLFWVIFFSNIIGSLLLSVYAVFRFGVDFKVPKSDRNMIFELLKGYGKWAIAKNYISSFNDNVRIWAIKLFISTEAVAIYSVAVSMVTTIRKSVPTQFISSLVPRFVSIDETIRKIYLRSTKYSIWLYSLIAFISYWAVPILVRPLMPQYIESIPYFRALLIVIIINSMLFNKQMLFSLKKQKFLFSTSFIEICSIFVFSIILVKYFGVWGAVYEMIVTESIMFTIVYYYLCKVKSDLRFSWKTLFIFNDEDKYWSRYLLDRVRRLLKFI